MKNFIKFVVLAISGIRLIPHAVLALTFSNPDLRADVSRWKDLHKTGHNESFLYNLLWLMTFLPEFRNLFYFRMGLKGKIFSPLCRGMNTLYLATPSIGPGLFIQHGFATILAADAVGANCWINQQVTVGYSNATDCPTIGDNVTIHAGAKIIGKVTIGNGATIGAGAVVVKNVPENCVVVGNPARIVRRASIRVDHAL